MATRLELQRYVVEELSEWEYHVEPESVCRLLNRAQDLFTRDSGYLRGVNVQSITANTSRYSLTPPSGYRIGRVLLVQFYDGSTDDWPLQIMSVQEMTDYDQDWRNRASGRPTHYVRNFDPGTADTPRNESLYLYPTPDANYTNGLRVNYTLVTDGQMSADATEMALPERIGSEALIAYACAEILMRKAIKDPDAASLLQGASERYRLRWEDEKERAVREASGGYDRKPRYSRGHWV